MYEKAMQMYEEAIQMLEDLRAWHIGQLRAEIVAAVDKAIEDPNSGTTIVPNQIFWRSAQNADYQRRQDMERMHDSWLEQEDKDNATIAVLSESSTQIVTGRVSRRDGSEYEIVLNTGVNPPTITVMGMKYSGR